MWIVSRNMPYRFKSVVLFLKITMAIMTILLFTLIYNKNMIRVSQEGAKYLIIERLKALFKVKKKIKKKNYDFSMVFIRHK